MSQGTLTLADVPAMVPDTLPTKKHLRAKHLFANQLALVPGLTLKKAKAIGVRYPTFKSLIEAFEKDGQDCLYSLGLVGKILSRKIYGIFGLLIQSGHVMAGLCKRPSRAFPVKRAQYY